MQQCLWLIGHTGTSLARNLAVSLDRDTVSHLGDSGAKGTLKSKKRSCFPGTMSLQGDSVALGGQMRGR